MTAGVGAGCLEKLQGYPSRSLDGIQYITLNVIEIQRIEYKYGTREGAKVPIRSTVPSLFTWSIICRQPQENMKLLFVLMLS